MIPRMRGRIKVVPGMPWVVLVKGLGAPNDSWGYGGSFSTEGYAIQHAEVMEMHCDVLVIELDASRVKAR